MKLFFFFFSEKGHFTRKGADSFALGGLILVWGTAYFFEDWTGFWFYFLMSLGAVLGFTGAWGGWVMEQKLGPVLNKIPFTNNPLGWRKALREQREKGQEKESDSSKQG